MTGSTLGGLASWHIWSNSGSWPRFVKRGGLEVLPYFPAHGREGEAAPLLRRNRLILLVQVAILMASRTLAKNQPFGQRACFGRRPAARWCRHSMLWTLRQGVCST